MQFFNFSIIIIIILFYLQSKKKKKHLKYNSSRRPVELCHPLPVLASACFPSLAARVLAFLIRFDSRYCPYRFAYLIVNKQMFLIWEKSCILILRASFDFLRRLTSYNISSSIDLWSEYLLHLTLLGFVIVLDFTSKPSCIIESSFSMWFQCPSVYLFIYFFNT